MVDNLVLHIVVANAFVASPVVSDAEFGVGGRIILDN